MRPPYTCALTAPVVMRRFWRAAVERRRQPRARALAVYHPCLRRYIAANWVWLSADGEPRPDHSPDGLTARQRTWLTLLEAPSLWGPWSLFHSDDNWALEDGSSGAYTPVIPPAWINETDLSFWIVSTQCCGNPEFPPTNHYSFNAQRVTLTLAAAT